jgi:putative ABC transport system permease protein
MAMMHADRGYDPASMLTARLPMPDGAFTMERRLQVLDALTERLKTHPQVSHIGYTDGLPLTSNETLSAFTMPSNRPPVGAMIQARAVRHVVSPDYLSALGMRVVAGRLFNSSDTGGSLKVVVVNRSFARQFLSDTALGDRIVNFATSSDTGQYEVIGIIDDVLEHGLNDLAQPEIYSLRQQTVFRAGSPGIVMRTTGDPRALVDSLRTIVREQNSSLALDSIMTMEDRLSASLEKPRFYALLLGVFSISALLIAGVGLFGVLSYSVSHRTGEFAVRTALGAKPADIIRLVLKQGLLIAIAGVGIGTSLSFAFTRYLAWLLYGVGSHDWVSIAGVSFLIFGIAAIACIAPAFRAIRIASWRALSS